MLLDELKKLAVLCVRFGRRQPEHRLGLTSIGRDECSLLDYELSRTRGEAYEPLQNSSGSGCPGVEKQLGLLGNHTGFVNTPNKSWAAKLPV